MTKTEYIQNLRIALDEANRIHRSIDSFFWVLSSFLLAGSGFAVSQALEMKGENYKVVILSSIMIIVCHWYRLFQKDTMDKTLFYLGKINYFEKELKIDVQPEDMTQITKVEIKETLLPYIARLKNVKGKSFHWIMGRVTYLFWIIWLLFIIEFIVKDWHNLYHPYCWPFY